MDNLRYYDKMCSPPEWAKKNIGGGRLKGMTDINPQWRIKALTEMFGPCGLGWYYEVANKWIEQGEGIERAAFVEVNLFVKYEGEWSNPIYGIGGSMFTTMERNGAHTSDECYKMATTDALSVACKQLGIGGDIYSGSKYNPKSGSGGSAVNQSKDMTTQEAIDILTVSTTIQGLNNLFKGLPKNRQQDKRVIEFAGKKKAELNG